MPDFDILGPNAYGSQPAQGSPGGFDIIANRPQVGPNGQPLAPNGQPLVNGAQAQQPQGAPMSGLLAGILGLPQYSGAVPGAVYATPGQAAAQATAAPGTQAPGSGLASALGMGARNLFDGVVGGGR
jgi:hypothetical protein